MGWAIGVLNLKTGIIDLFVGQTLGTEDHGTDVHVIPCNPVNEQNDLDFGAHEFTRQCYCHPTTKPGPKHQVFIFHREIVN